MDDAVAPGAAGYGQPGEALEPPRTEGLAIAALLVAVAGLFIFLVCAFVTGCVSLAMANQAHQKIAASGGQLTGNGLVTAARVVAIVSIVLSITGLAYLISTT